MVTNQEFIDGYNEYLKTHNLTETNLVYVNFAGQTNFPVDKDLFLDYLIDVIALQKVTQVEFNDPLDILYKGNVTYGTKIEDIRTILPYAENGYDVEDFNKNVANPFEKHKKNVSVLWHRVDLRKTIRVTVSEEQLYSAFETPYGINSLVNSFVTDIQTQKYAWDYDKKKKAIADIKFATKFTVKSFEELSIKIKDTVTDFKSYDKSRNYNRAVLPTPTQISNVYIIMAEKWKNKMDVSYFTGLFNVSFAEIKERILYVDAFPDKKTVCVICDERGLFFYKVLDAQRNILNPGDLTRNEFLHFWRMISTSQHFNAVMINYDEKPAENVPKITIGGQDYLQDDNLGFITDTEVTLSANGATNVKYSIDDKEPISLSDTATITVTKYNTIRFIYDGGESMYAIRVQKMTE